MEPAKLLTASFNDILFEGRNKDYGAYQLRKTYEKRLVTALMITTCCCFLIAGGAYVKSYFFKEEVKPFFKISDGPTITNIKEEQEKPLPPPPKTTPPKVEAPKIKSILFTKPIVVDNRDVVDPPPMQQDIQTAKISTITQDGVNDTRMIILPESIGEGKGIVEAKKIVEKDDGIFKKVEIEAEYPGGTSAWRNFLERNLRGDVAVDNGATAGSYTVIIEFVVDVNGSISDIVPLTNFGHGMEQEAKRVIQKSGKWKAAIQNGRSVKAYRKQPITFMVQEQ